MPDRLSAADIRRACGDIPDWKLAAMLATPATLGDLEAAIAYAEGEDDPLREEGKPLSGPTARLYDILMAGEEEPDER